MPTLTSFEDLDCWKKCRELRKNISKLIDTFPTSEKFALMDQIKRSSRSTTANIAEGYGRFHYKENVQFCRMSRGSLYETKDHLITAFDEGFIDIETFKTLEVQLNECLALLNGYINYLQKNIEK